MVSQSQIWLAMRFCGTKLYYKIYMTSTGYFFNNESWLNLASILTYRTYVRILTVDFQSLVKLPIPVPYRTLYERKRYFIIPQNQYGTVPYGCTFWGWCNGTLFWHKDSFVVGLRPWFWYSLVVKCKNYSACTYVDNDFTPLRIPSPTILMFKVGVISPGTCFMVDILKGPVVMRNYGAFILLLELF